jgi:hypothetical protein
VFIPTAFAFDRFAGPVPGMLARTGESIKYRGFSGIRIPRQSNRQLRITSHLRLYRIASVQRHQVTVFSAFEIARFSLRDLWVRPHAPSGANPSANLQTQASAPAG